MINRAFGDPVQNGDSEDDSEEDDESVADCESEEKD